MSSADFVGRIVLKNWNDVGSHEGSDLSNRRSIGVVLTTDGSSTGLGCTQADVVARAEFAEGKKDAIVS